MGRKLQYMPQGPIASLDSGNSTVPERLRKINEINKLAA